MIKKIKKKPVAKYVDGFVLVVSNKRKDEYKKMAQDAGRIWLECGALSYKECVGDDLNPDMGEYSILKFSTMAKLKSDETVWFSYIEYKSKAHRDAVNKRVMKEMTRLSKDTPDHIENMPFDMKRMAFGGFKVIVDA